MANRAKIKNQLVNVGDTVKVFQKIKEKDKERIQVFRGIVIRIKGSLENKTFTVRRIGSAGIGIERIWPVNSPWIDKLEVVKKGKVRRAKLYYLRQRIGKKATRVKAKKLNKEKQPDKVDKVKNTKSQNKDEAKKPGKSGRKPRSPVSAK